MNDKALLNLSPSLAPGAGPSTAPAGVVPGRALVLPDALVGSFSAPSIPGHSLVGATVEAALAAAVQLDGSMATDAIRQLAEELRLALPVLTSRTDRDKELRANVSTLEAPLTLAAPHRTILREALGTIRIVLQGIDSPIALELLAKM